MFGNNNFMKTKLSIVLDFVFGTVFVFLICMLWARFFIHNLFVCILICAIITFCVVALYILISKKNTKKITESKKELSVASDISTYFLLCTKQETLKEFHNILSNFGSVKSKGDVLLTNDVAIRPLYYSTEITDKDVLESFAKIKNTSIKKIVLCCKSSNPKAKEIAEIIKEKQIIILTEFDAYKKIYEPANFVVKLPSNPKEKSTIKERIKNYSQFALNKQRTKNYLFVSVALLIGSFILRYNIYYLIFATLTTALALYSHFNKKFNNSTA